MKRRLRKEMKALLAAMGTEEAAGRSRAACTNLLALPQFTAARAVMLYNPIVGEVDCVPVALSAWRHGKTVLLPKVSYEQRHLLPVECLSLDDEMVPGSFGIGEPAGGRPWPLELIDFVVVPALAYDRRGYRLGRGGGFYDRFLTRDEVRAVACGLGFSRQLVDALPVQPHDRRLDLLVTDVEILKFNE